MKSYVYEMYFTDGTRHHGYSAMTRQSAESIAQQLLLLNIESGVVTVIVLET